MACSPRSRPRSEYDLTAVLIAIVINAGLMLVGDKLNLIFNNIANCLGTPASYT